MSPLDTRPWPPVNRPRRRRTLISFTPLIDVVFILLVFFMLASSFLDRRAIALDAPATGAAGAPLEGALLVEVRESGLRLSGVTVSPEALEANLRTHLEKRPDRRIVVQPAPGISLDRTIVALDRIAAAGARNIAFAGRGSP